MSMLVTVSQIDKGKHVPSRQERDDAFSSGAGRKAVEKTKQGRSKHLSNRQVLHRERSQGSQEAKRRLDSTSDAPIGLELETRFMPSIGTALETGVENS